MRRKYIMIILIGEHKSNKIYDVSYIEAVQFGREISML